MMLHPQYQTSEVTLSRWSKLVYNFWSCRKSRFVFVPVGQILSTGGSVNPNSSSGVRWFKAQGEFLVSMGGWRIPQRGRGHVGRRGRSARPWGSLASGHARFPPGCPWLTNGPCFSWLPRRWAREGGGTRGGVRIDRTRSGNNMHMTQWHHNGTTRHIHMDATKSSSTDRRPPQTDTEDISRVRHD